MNRENLSCQRKTENVRKAWSCPSLFVFGTVKKLTRNIGQVGSGDVEYEQPHACQSPGNCGVK